MRFYVKESRFQVDPRLEIGGQEISAKIKTAKKCGNFKNHPLQLSETQIGPPTPNLTFKPFFKCFATNHAEITCRLITNHFLRVFTIFFCSKFYRAFYTNGNGLSEIAKISHYLITKIRLLERKCQFQALYGF